MNCSDIAERLGRTMLFCGVETYSWSIAQFQEAARFAAMHHIDTLLVKVGEGSWWYNGIDTIKNIHDTIHTMGVGCIPYIYSNGGDLLNNDIAMIKELLATFGYGCADMESQWNGHADWATTLCNALQGQSGDFLVSTWGDPRLQQWDSVIKALNPCVAAYLPQQYTDYLAGQWSSFSNDGAKCLFPTVYIGNDLGDNDPVANAKAAFTQGHTSLGIWEYSKAIANPQIVDAIIAAFPAANQENDMPLQITDPLAAAYFTEVPGATPPRWHCTNTQYDITGAILDYYRKTGGAFRLPISQEIYNVIPGGSFQLFEGGVLTWDPQRSLDDPPTAQGDVYAMKISIDSPGLRQLMTLAGISLSPDAVATAKLTQARNSISAAIAGLQAASQNLQLPQMATASAT